MHLDETQPSPDLQPWLETACRAVGIPRHRLDTAALIALAGQVAASGLRPMAPVAARIWGLALSRGGDPETTRRAIIESLPAQPVATHEREDRQHWQLFVQGCCHRLQLAPGLVPLEEIPALTREVAHASIRPMAPVVAHLLGLTTDAGPTLRERTDAVLEALSRAATASGQQTEAGPTGNPDPQVAS
ncbi:MAG: DUF6457 domain-containing protein [Luteococcus sp.]|uniref:DUF6457 domain-containing protein n=1 Tax=Luteococcus sp. TaxID=1969402 RepID=UPI00264902D4|nr:DUF6457 domain-containing protein [Luteococcus sp.]MDN5564197.1 DUF6457 domain-containing protein [Luteococcus sp.]